MEGYGLYVVAAILGAIVLYLILTSNKKEHYRDPIYLNRRKYLCDYYPRSSGSIYGEASNVLSGFPFYDKAY
jgi:hypothetical protein